MKAMKAKIRTAGIWLAALLLAMLMGILVTHAAGADGPVLWKQHCPRWHDVRLEPDAGGDGVHVLCVRQAEEEEKR